MPKTPDDLTPPAKTIVDNAHQVLKAATSVVVPAGGYLIDAVMAAPMTKRMGTWWETISEAIRELQDKYGRIPEDLSNDEAFIDVVAQASRAAAFTSSKVKLDALRNAILNAGASRGVDDDERLIFVRLIDELTEWHLKILDFFDDPLGWFGRNDVIPYSPSISSSNGQSLTTAFPKLRDQREFYDAIAADLKTQGLGDIDLHVIMTAAGWESSRTSSRGKRFLAFIRRR